MKLDAIRLNSGVWAVKPEGQLGTCGFYPKAWTVQFIKASSKDKAIKIAERRMK